MDIFTCFFYRFFYRFFFRFSVSPGKRGRRIRMQQNIPPRRRFGVLRGLRRVSFIKDNKGGMALAGSGSGGYNGRKI